MQNAGSIKTNIEAASAFKPLLEKKDNCSIRENNDYYLFKVKDTAFIKTQEKPSNYISKLFAELFPGRKYNHEKYVIIADSNEVSLYNFFSNNLLAKFVSSFTLDQRKVHKENGYYVFAVKKALFDEPLKPGDVE